MNKVLVGMVLLFLFSKNSMAQTQIAAAEVSKPEVAGVSIEEKPKSSFNDFSLSYLGVLFGPGFSTELNGKTKDGDDLYVHNRPTLKYKLNENTLLGVQPRFNIKFLPEGTTAELDNFRVQAEFKNIYKTDIFNFGITPRLALPTSAKSNKRSMLPSPELMGKLDYSPKDTKFQFDSWYMLGSYYYGDSQNAANAVRWDSTLALESTYQLTNKFAFTFGYYMEHASKTNAAMTSVSNEIDLGVNLDFAKGWSVNPMVATECNGLGANGTSISKNMGLYVWVSGAVL